MECPVCAGHFFYVRQSGVKGGIGLPSFGLRGILRGIRAGLGRAGVAREITGLSSVIEVYKRRVWLPMDRNHTLLYGA